MSKVIDEHVDKLKRLYHTPSAAIIAEEVARIEAKSEEHFAARGRLANEVERLSALHADSQRQIDALLEELKGLRHDE